jgi:murein DD-endopeptidase MepM/ murein hydrolase activator NlpD
MWVRWCLGFALALALAACGGGGVPTRVSGAPPAQQPPPRAGVPQSAQADPAPIMVTVAPGDTIASLADRYQVSIRDLIDANRLEPPYQLTPGRTVTIPAGRGHRVMRGETLYGIARLYRTDLATVARLNRLAPPYRIYEGQSLRIPTAVPAPMPVTVAAAEPAPAPTPAPAATEAASPRPAVEVSPVAPPPQAQSMTPPAASSPLPPTTPEAAPSPAAGRPEPPPSAPPASAAGPQIAALPPLRAGSLLFSWPAKGRIISGFGPKPGGQHNDGINIETPRGSPVRAAEAGTVVYAGNELKGYGNLVLIRHAGGWVTAYAHNDEILVRRGAQIGKGHLIAKSGASGGVATPQVHFEIRRGRDPVDPMRYLGAPETVSGAAGRGGPPGPG